MEPGNYIAIARDDLSLPDCQEHWIKGNPYKVVIEPDGVMRLQGELIVSYYTPEAVEKFKDLFRFIRDNGQNDIKN